MNHRRPSVLVCALAPALALAQDAGVTPAPAPPIPATVAATPAPVRIASLPTGPKLDGKIDRGARPFASSAEPGQAGLTGVAGLVRDTLYLAVEVEDRTPSPSDALDVTLHFPGGGVLSSGRTYRFSADGQRTVPDGAPTPAHASAATKVALGRRAEGFTVELLLPLVAWPQFPVKSGRTLEVCLTYQDHSLVGEGVRTASTCSSGRMRSPPLAMPDGVFPIGLKPPRRVLSLAARPLGVWAGYGDARLPVWLHGRRPLLARQVPSLAADTVTPVEDARLSLPARLQTPTGMAIVPVIAGLSPFADDGTCTPDRTQTLGLYAVRGRTATLVLEWPVGSCPLGRATSLSVDEEAALTIGYSTGQTVNFAWSDDHFERTEFGALWP